MTAVVVTLLALAAVVLLVVLYVAELVWGPKWSAEAEERRAREWESGTSDV